MSRLSAYDLTHANIGDWLIINGQRFYDLPFSVCPLCGRVGQQATLFDPDVWMHVVCFNKEDDGFEHAPVWISDLCHTLEERLTLSYPAQHMNRVKHPYEIAAGEVDWTPLEQGSPGIGLCKPVTP